MYIFNSLQYKYALVRDLKLDLIFMLLERVMLSKHRCFHLLKMSLVSKNLFNQKYLLLQNHARLK